jgi:hypothetical protein
MTKTFGNASKALFVGAAIVLGLAATAGTASALPNCTPGCDFTINPNSLVPNITAIPPTANNPTPNTVIGQDIQGNYTEVITFNPNGTWSTQGWIQFTTLIAGTGNDCTPCTTGTAVPSTFTALNSQMFLNADFTASGTFVTNAPNVNMNFTTFSTTGLFADYFTSIDSYNPNGTLTRVAPDTQLLTAAFINGTASAIIQPPPANSVGSFIINLAPTLISPAGELYFTQPRPFFIKLDLSGQFIPVGFDFTNTTTPQTFTFANV